VMNTHETDPRCVCTDGREAERDVVDFCNSRICCPTCADCGPCDEDDPCCVCTGRDAAQRIREALLGSSGHHYACPAWTPVPECDACDDGTCATCVGQA
jgi:hypothetical protein